MELTLIVGKSVFGGDCLAVADGKTCFVEDALPGEKVLVRVVSRNKKYLRARVIRVLEPSPNRTAPVCAHVTDCGGCQYQHVSYEEELRLKEEQIREILRVLPDGGSSLRSIEPSPRPLGYRSSATFQGAGSKKGSPASLAYIGRDNVTPIVLRECPLLDGPLRELVASRPTLKPGRDRITFKSYGGRVVSDEKELFFRAPLMGRELVGHSKGFFQVNLGTTERILARVREIVKHDRPTAFWDLYSGVGTFFLLGTPDPMPGILLEESPYALQALRMNLSEYARPSVAVHEGRVERTFAAAWKKEGRADAMIFMDPPRQGLGEGLAGFLAKEVDAKRIVYLSCDPTTLCRDLKTILSRGDRKIDSIEPFDMFPRTKHIEVLACMSKIN